MPSMFEKRQSSKTAWAMHGETSRYRGFLLAVGMAEDRGWIDSEQAEEMVRAIRQLEPRAAAYQDALIELEQKEGQDGELRTEQD